MKPRKLAVLGLMLLAIAGCRTDPAIPLLERELRIKEDEIYRLRATVEDLQCECQTDSHRDRILDSRPADEPEPAVSTHRRRGSNGSRDTNGANGVSNPGIELPGQPSGRVPDALKSPGRPLPPASVPDVPDEIRGPSRSSSSSDDGPSFGRAPDVVGSRPGAFRTAAGSGSSAVPFTPSADSRHSASIALDPVRTGGIGPNDGSGDRGLLVVVEPRDAAGRPIDAPAEIHVTALDPALKSMGDAARVGRWNFSPAETAALFRRSGSGCAIHLAMGWAADPPKHNKLDLFVRYVTADGRALEAHQPVEIALPGERTARWTPAESPRPVEQPKAREPREYAPRMATRPVEPKPERPVWSPERR